MKQHHIIHVQPEAAAKPMPGAPCNGCGVCCLVEPCPLGMLLSRRRSGACVALRWQASAALYRCGALSDSAAVLRQVMPGWLQPVVPRLAPWLARLARRWIAAGQGCDCRLEVRRRPQFDRQSPHD